MKKKLKISESQAQYILRLSEDLDPGTTSSDTGKFACGKKHTNPPTIGCIGPGNYTMGDPGIQAVYPTMSACQNDPECGGGSDDPCKDNPNPECFWCQAEQGSSCVPVGTNLSYAMSNGYSLYQTVAACDLAEQDCGGGRDNPCPDGVITPADGDWGFCNECIAGGFQAAGGALSYPWGTITGDSCECCKEDGDPHTGGKVDCVCCDKDGNAAGMAQQVATAADCATTNFGAGFTDCVEHTTPYVDPCKRGNTQGCPDVECANPLHVQVMISAGPPPKCKCQCENTQSCLRPLVWNETTCSCTGEHDKFVGPPLQSENKTELNEELKRIKQLLR